MLQIQICIKVVSFRKILILDKSCNNEENITHMALRVARFSSKKESSIVKNLKMQGVESN